MLAVAAHTLPGVETEWSTLETADQLRDIVSTKLFDFQCGMYSSGRRRAPIFLQLATASGMFSVWLPYQQLNGDTLFDAARTIVAPKLRHEVHRLEHLRIEGGASPTSSQRRLIEGQQRVVDDCVTFAEQLNTVAGLWAPDLNDGVAINCAPLWRCFGGSSVWQKECKACWEGLCDHKYEWSHMAMHLWPERVVPKCQNDRSLAIAHGLEDVFWEQDGRGKWVKRTPPEEAGKAGWQPTIDRLVAERTSRQVKDALAKLLAAPTAEGGGKRGRRSQATTELAASGDAARNGTKRKGKSARTRDESEELF